MKKIFFIAICLLIITGCGKQELEETKTPNDTLILELVKTPGCKNQVTKNYHKKCQLVPFDLLIVQY